MKANPLDLNEAMICVVVVWVVKSSLCFSMRVVCELESSRERSRVRGASEDVYVQKGRGWNE